MTTFDIQETTVQFDHTNRIVEFYTTKRSVFLSLIKRNPNYIKAEELNPGYSIDYALEECRAAPMILKPAKGGGARMECWMTEAEIIKRREACERLNAGKTI